jgi:SsrA-binding protein
VKSLRSARRRSPNPTPTRARRDLADQLEHHRIPAGRALQSRAEAPRKLLLHKRQINKLIGAVEREGMTLVPLKLYFNEKGRAKVELALAKGKKLHDKRETEKKRDWDREKGA